jgi:hypothetical protein
MCPKAASPFRVCTPHSPDMDTRQDQEQPLLYEPDIDNKRLKRNGGINCLK